MEAILIQTITVFVCTCVVCVCTHVPMRVHEYCVLFLKHQPPFLDRFSHQLDLDWVARELQGVPCVHPHSLVITKVRQYAQIFLQVLRIVLKSSWFHIELVIFFFVAVV